MMAPSAGPSGPGIGRILAIALRETRGAKRRFLAFVVSLALGIAVIAGIGSLAAAIEAGLARDARIILGGDVEVRLTYRPADARELARLAASGRVSHIVELRAMARGAAPSPVLAEIKAIDPTYPLFGTLRLEGATAPGAALAQGADGIYGAIAERSLAERLGIGIGDFIAIGETRYRLTGIILAEPDRALQGFSLGPRLMIAGPALEKSGLIQPGALVYHSYRLALNPSETPSAWIEKLRADFPDSGWRIRSLDDAAGGVRDFIGQARLFLILVGFGALLIGGIGIANAVAAYLESRAASLAILKCLGATSRLIFAIYGLQIAGASGIGIAIGLILGAAVPILLQGALADLGLSLPAAIYPAPLLLAALIGALTALVFSAAPLLRARRLNAAQLFRARLIDLGETQFGDRLVLGLFAALLALIAAIGSGDIWLGGGFVIAAVLVLIAFRLLGSGLHRLAVALRHLAGARGWPLSLRLALLALARSRHAIGMVVLSLGLGLTVLTTIGLIERSLAAAIERSLPETAPSFYFIDIQPDQIGPLREALTAYPGASRFESVPMLRGRIVRIGDVPAEKIAADEDVDWVLRGDRGITWAAIPPANAEIVAGEWWPADYRGPLLISFDAEAAAGLGLKVGDSLTVNILGRELTGKIANLRRIDWRGLDINFVMIFSPGEISAAPQTHIATIHIARNGEAGLLVAMARQFPNVSAIAVRDALDQVAGILRHLGWAIRAAAAMVILIGALVLGNAIASQQQRRLYEAVLLKMLGGRRRDLALAYAIEFLGLGGIAAGLALALGAGAAAILLFSRFEIDLVFAPELAAFVLALALLLVLGLGFAGTWRALGARTAPYLRND